MKKTFLVAAFAVVSTCALAQTSFGIKAGGNLSTFSGESPFKKEMLASYHAGFMSEFKLSDKFSIQPELLFSEQGSKGSFSNVGVSYPGTVQEVKSEIKIEGITKLSYINLPVLAKLYITEGLSLNIGPQIGYLLSYEANRESSSVITYNGKTEKENRSYSSTSMEGNNRIDYGATAGLGYRFNSGLSFDARYYYGLSRLSKDPFDHDTSNRTIQVSLGYFF